MTQNHRLAHVELLLFDLDNTLYPRDLGLWREIDRRILDYVCRTLGLPPEEARRVQKYYWRTYGTTISGLIAEHQVDPVPYLEYVHDFDATVYLQPNRKLARILAALPQRKAIFTNATAEHARNILTALDVIEHFDPLIGMDDVGYISKPDPRAYERCFAMLGVAPEHCLFLEDSPKNVVPAREMGALTALVGAERGEADYHLDRIEDLAQLFALDV
ncbi:MAG: pyrimidine 5'-nucleotidase [Chloroflexi bacterium]|nr:pyrimidine 5'-nucleotidase [Chloroflexota bacterium]